MNDVVNLLEDLKDRIEAQVKENVDQAANVKMPDLSGPFRRWPLAMQDASWERVKRKTDAILNGKTIAELYEDMREGRLL